MHFDYCSKICTHGVSDAVLLNILALIDNNLLETKVLLKCVNSA